MNNTAAIGFNIKQTIVMQYTTARMYPGKITIDLDGQRLFSSLSTDLKSVLFVFNAIIVFIHVLLQNLLTKGSIHLLCCLFWKSRIYRYALFRINSERTFICSLIIWYVKYYWLFDNKRNQWTRRERCTWKSVSVFMVSLNLFVFNYHYKIAH